MTNVMEAVEYAAWQLAAEPVEWRMERLLELVRETAPEIAGIKGVLRAPVAPEVVDLLSMPNPPVNPPVAVPGDDRDVPDDSASDASAEAAFKPVIAARDLGALPQRRACTGCQREFPLTLEFFSSDSSRRDGLRGRCRDCERAQRAARRKAKNGDAA